MRQELEKIINDSPIVLESNQKIREMVAHNLGLFLQIHSSYKICKAYFYDFDFRDEYWWKPENRLLGKYYIDYFKDDFFPPVELRMFLFTVFSAAKEARKAGVFDFVPEKYSAFFTPDVFKRIGVELAKIVRKTAFDSKSLREAHPRQFKDYTSISEHLAEYVEKFCKENEDADMNGTLVNRFQFLPYYLAQKEDDLKAATFFMSSYYTLFTATNAYQTGAAQNFGPILGNNSTKQFVQVVDRWMTGESISKTGFKVHDSDSKEPQDKSEYVAILELHGFSRLQFIPYVNKVVMKQYRLLFGLENADGKEVQQRVGSVIREYLNANSALVTRMAELWDKHLTAAKNSFALHFEPERIQRPKQREQFSAQLINGPLLEEYKKHVPGIGQAFSPIDKAQALVHLCLDADAYLHAGSEVEEAEEVIDSNTIAYWSIAPGEGAQYWDEWKSQRIISLGWEELGDLSQFKSQDALKEKYIKVFSPNRDPINDSKALYEFRNTLKIGDIVFAKDGRSKLLGVGKVISDYFFDKTRSVHNNTHRVEWVKTGEWILEDDKFAIKALTNITDYTDFVRKLLKLAGMQDPSASNGGHVATNTSLPNTKNTIYWGPPGTGKTFKLLQMQSLFRDSSSGNDDLVAWVQELGWWDAIAAALIDLGKPVTVPELFKHEFIQLKVKQQSGNKTPKNTLWGQLQAHTVATSTTVNFERRQEPLVVDKSAESKWSLVGDWKSQLDDLVEEVQKIRSGKSQTVTERFKVITFHQSYSYEEFVEGIRPERLPDGSGISYQVKDGVFKLLCQRALENPDKEYAIFIDEINRGNISKIFGELITLIEEDKRIGARHEVTITLPYSGKRFGVPKNLYVIGTMNSVDRSIALVDMALRRRFEFISVRPNAELINPPSLSGVDLRSLFGKLNQKISVILGTEYQIGHSYFMERNVSSIEAFRKTWFGSILPLLQEYLFDDWDKIEALVGNFVIKTEVKDLENLSLPRFSYGSFVADGLPVERFVELLRELE